MPISGSLVLAIAGAVAVLVIVLRLYWRGNREPEQKVLPVFEDTMRGDKPVDAEEVTKT